MIGALVAGITGLGGASLSSYESIATVTASGSVSTLSFTSIPSTFKHLQIRGIAYDGVGNEIGVRFNSDSGSNYTRHNLYGNGSITGAGGSVSQTRMNLAIPGYTSDYPACFIIDILDYASTTKNKTARSFYGFDTNSQGQVQMRSGLWINTNAVTAIELYDTGGTNYSTITTFALYGIKESA